MPNYFSKLAQGGVGISGLHLRVCTQSSYESEPTCSRKPHEPQTLTDDDLTKL